MFSVRVRDHMMIAHSLEGEIFGPAQQLHGATYVVDVEFRRRELDADGVVIDIGLASKALAEVLAAFNYRNLDEEESLAGLNTTTENLARIIFERLVERVRDDQLGPSAKGLCALCITLGESHVAWASFEGEL